MCKKGRSSHTKKSMCQPIVGNHLSLLLNQYSEINSYSVLGWGGAKESIWLLPEWKISWFRNKHTYTHAKAHANNLSTPFPPEECFASNCIFHFIIEKLPLSVEGECVWSNHSKKKTQGSLELNVHRGSLCLIHLNYTEASFISCRQMCPKYTLQKKD